MRRLLVLACLLVPITPSAASPLVVAHRGGPLDEGRPVRAENTLPAFKRAAKQGWVLEFDISLTKDGQAVVIHDDKVDRTTDCTGLVKDFTAAQLRAQCRVDVLGSTDVTAPIPEGDRPVVPTLDEVLAVAAQYDVSISPEIKNIPPTTQDELLVADDFDPDPRGFATTVSNALLASGFPQERMVVQSFWPPNLEVARTILPRAELSFLTLEQTNDPGPEFALARGFAWISPGFGSGLNPTYVERAHAYGRRVTVYTPNSEDDIRTAVSTGVDAIISDDPDRVVRLSAP